MLSFDVTEKIGLFLSFFLRYTAVAMQLIDVVHALCETD